MWLRYTIVVAASLPLSHMFAPIPSTTDMGTTITHTIAAEPPVLEESLQAAGWTRAMDVCGSSLPTTAWQKTAADMTFESHDAISGRQDIFYLWRQPGRAHNLPQWVGVARSHASPLGGAVATYDAKERVTYDLLNGIAVVHDSHEKGMHWIELRHAPSEIEHHLMPAAAAVCSVVGGDQGDITMTGLNASEEPLLPPSLPLSEPAFESLVWRENTGDKRVALTFDACSTFDYGNYNPEVIDVLQRELVPATLFIGGHWAEMHPQELQQLAQDPLFELGNHTYSHPHMITLSLEQQRQQVLWTQYAIYSRTGRVPTFLRPPYGEIDDTMIEDMARLGLTTIEFDVPAGDADEHVNPKILTDWVVRKATGGSIVVMHMNHPKNRTAVSLPDIVRQLRAKGYEFVQVSKLLHTNESGE
jgi:peptidoglycan/xylan/chitin deacetylase (PgdA/CDA1 family)